MSHHIEKAEDIRMEWFKNVKTVGICGATSTPKWLMEKCRDYIIEKIEKRQDD